MCISFFELSLHLYSCTLSPQLSHFADFSSERGRWREREHSGMITAAKNFNQKEIIGRIQQHGERTTGKDLLQNSKQHSKKCTKNWIYPFKKDLLYSYFYWVVNIINWVHRICEQQSTQDNTPLETTSYGISTSLHVTVNVLHHAVRFIPVRLPCYVTVSRKYDHTSLKKHKQ